MKPLAPVTRQRPSRGRSAAAVCGGARAAHAGVLCGGAAASRWRCRARPTSSCRRRLSQSASTASSASRKLLRLGLGERQRRQQLDHVVLAGGHRDHAVVAVQRDHDELREETLACHVDQAPVELRDARAGRLQLDADHQPARADLLDHLIALPAAPRGRRSRKAPTLAACSTSAVALDDPQRREPGGHREAVAPVGRLVDVAALERADGLLEDLARGDHRGDRHVAAAERLADEHEVGLEARSARVRTTCRCARARSGSHRATNSVP